MPVNILNLPGLKVLDFKETDAEYHIRAEPAAISRLCPHCGRSHDTIKHAQKTLFVRDLPSHGKSVAIHLDAPRLLCKLCNKTFTAAVPEVDIARQMTERLARWIGRQSLEYTYAEIAKQANVDEKTVRNIFDEYVAGLEKQFKRETPPWLGIDEIKLGRFRAVFTDNKIVELVEAGDLVITADIPLAAEVIARGAQVLDPRGELYTKDTIQERLTMRNFMETLRSSGVETGGPSGFSQRDCQNFAKQLDKLLAKQVRRV